MESNYISYSCSKCDKAIGYPIYRYSSDKFQIPLCLICQGWYKNLPTKPSSYAKELFINLKNRGFQVILEDDDGYKRIDIVVKDAMVHIEVDGDQHHRDAKRAINDLWRTYYSIKNGYNTLRIPNSAIQQNVEQTAEIISRILLENKKQLYNSSNSNPGFSFARFLGRMVGQSLEDIRN